MKTRSDKLIYEKKTVRKTEKKAVINVTCFSCFTNLCAHGCKLHEVEANHNNLLHLHRLPEKLEVKSQTSISQTSEKEESNF